MRASVLISTIILLSAAATPLSAQAAPAELATPARSVDLHAGLVLPPSLALPAPGESRAGASRAELDVEPMPFLGALFGGLAGMFIGKWWMEKDCTEDCEGSGFLGLLAGGMLGAVVGYLIGGGHPSDFPGD